MAQHRRIIDGRYELLELLAEGSMGRVYHARDQVDQRHVALKLVRAELEGDDEVVARFHREMVVTARIDHVNTVEVLHHGRAETGELYLVMELLSGASLREILDEEAPLDLKRAVSIATQIARALAAAHARGVLHRDLKPDNVVIEADALRGELVKVLDFGLAFLDDEASWDRLTAIGARVGSPTYMAPEYIAHEAPGPSGDVYALGILLYEMITGSAPFEGKPYEVLDQHLHATPIDPRALRPETPAWLAEVVLALIAKSPADRPPSAEAVVVALQVPKPARRRATISWIAVVALAAWLMVVALLATVTTVILSFLAI